jgi:hypothetical protein
MAVVAAILLLGLAAGLYAALRDGSSKAEPGCIEVPAAHSTGGTTLKSCGADAARWCRSAAARDDALARAVRAHCRSAGYH